MDKNVSLQNFISAANAVIGSKFILSSGKVSNLLRTIASDDYLFGVVGDCMGGFDYKTECVKAAIVTDKGKSFRLPYSKKRVVALVTYLLYDFDSQNKNIIDFMDEFSAGEDVNEKYENFCSSVLKPYVEAFIAVSGGDNGEGESEPVENDVKVTSIPDGAVVQIEYIVRDINAQILESAQYEKAEREDLLLLVDGVNRALESRDVRLLKSLVVGMKYAFSEHKKISKKIKDIEACLKLYLVS